MWLLKLDGASPFRLFFVRNPCFKNAAVSGVTLRKQESQSQTWAETSFPGFPFIPAFGLCDFGSDRTLSSHCNVLEGYRPLKSSKQEN